MKFIKDDKYKQQCLEKALAKLKQKPHVAIGILQDKTVSDDFSIVDLALVHEYGSQNGYIPQRSFIRSTCDAKQKQHVTLIAKLQGKIIDGALSIKQALTTLGEVVAKDMVKTINRGINPELKPATIKRKGSAKSLIDTGRLKGSITHEVRGAL